MLALRAVNALTPVNRNQEIELMRSRHRLTAGLFAPMLLMLGFPFSVQFAMSQSNEPNTDQAANPMTNPAWSKPTAHRANQPQERQADPEAAELRDTWRISRQWR
jgi:hypothetical protein